MSLHRDGCCESWPKPCGYHEGVADAIDASLGSHPGLTCSAAQDLIDFYRTPDTEIDVPSGNIDLGSSWSMELDTDEMGRAIARSVGHPSAQPRRHWRNRLPRMWWLR